MMRERTHQLVTMEALRLATRCFRVAARNQSSRLSARAQARTRSAAPAGSSGRYTSAMVIDHSRSTGRSGSSSR